MSRRALRLAAAAALCGLGYGPGAFAQLAAFPGALGYGAQTTGARAGGAGLSVYQVTNLSNSGSGSFRDAVSQSDRIIVFDVGGNIDISTPISAASNLTILGQTAPGQGIAIYGAETSFYGQSNDIVRYMRFMDTTLDPGGQGNGNSSGNCINLGNTNNMIFDHVSCEFASYNNIDASGTTGANNLTFQNSIVADPILDQEFNFHWEGNQGTFINNIFANGINRSILAKGNTQFVNNTLYNYESGFTTGNSGGAFNFDIVNNYFKTGPSKTNNGNYGFYQVDSSQTAYASGNVLDTDNGTVSGSSYNTTGATVSNSPLLAGTTSLPTLSAAASFAWNAAHSGDSLTHNTSTYATSLAYDEVDATVISNVNSLGTAGRMYNGEDDDGISDGPTAGIGPVASGTVVNPNYSTLPNPEGYTEVEAWANAMSDSNLDARVWTASSGEWNTPNSWNAAPPLSLVAPGVYDIAYVEGNGAGADGSVNVSTAGNAYQLYIGGNGGSAGEKVDVTGGSLTIYDTVTVGYQNNATLEVDSGTAIANNIQLGNTVGTTTYNGDLILNGGTLEAGQIVLGAGAPGAWTTGGSITYNGGTVLANNWLNINAPGTLQAGGAIINTNGSNGTISGALAGIGALTKLGAGTLDLTGSNSFTGGVVLEGGELAISSNANIGGASGTISFLGGLLQVQGTAITNLGTHPFNTSTFNGGFDIASAGNTFTVSQNLGGSGSLTTTGAGEVQLTGSNSYSGGTTIDGGTLSVSADDNLGAPNGTLTINGGVLDVSGTTYTSTADHPLTGNFNGGFNIDTMGAVFTVSQQINGTGNITKYGPGTLVLGTRDYLSGNAILDGGTVTISDPLSLRYLTVEFNTAGSTVNLNGIQGPTIGGISGSQNFDMQGTNPLIGNNNANTSYTGTLSSSVTGGFTKIGTGTLTLTGNNTYTGVTEISGGILSVGSLANGGTASPVGQASNIAANLVFNGGTLQYTGTGTVNTDHLFTITANGGTLDASGSAPVGYTSTGAIALPAGANVALTLTGNNGNHNGLYASLGNPVGGYQTSLIKSGTGLWDLEGSGKTYSGATTVVAGELQTLATNVMSPSSDVTVDSGATLDFHASSQTIGALNGAGTVSDSFDNSTDTLTIGANNDGGSFGGTLGVGLPNLIKEGTGLETLSGSNNYTGTTTVNAGQLQFAALNSVGASTLTLGGGGSTGASILVSASGTLANPITAAAGSTGTLRFAGGTAGTGLTVTGVVTIPSNTTLTLGSGGTSTNGLIVRTGGITGGGNVAIDAGAGSVNYYDNSSTEYNYSGTTTIISGTLQANQNVGSGAIYLGTSTGTLAATLLTNYGIPSSDPIIVVSGDTGTLRIGGAGSNGRSTNGTITLQNNVTLGGGSATNNQVNINGAIVGTGNVTVDAGTSGYVKLGSSDSFAGNALVITGELQLGSSAALTSANILAVSTGTDANILSNITVSGLEDGSALSGGTGTGYVTDNSTTSRTLTFGGTTAGASYSYTGTFTAPSTGTLSLATAATFAGTQTISANDSFSGTVTANGGTLAFIGSETFAGNVTVGGGTLVLNGTNTFNGSTAAPTVTTGLLSTNNIKPTGTASAIGTSGTITLGTGTLLYTGPSVSGINQNISGSSSGYAINVSQPSTTLGLTGMLSSGLSKTGTGTLMLSAFTGNATFSAGTSIVGQGSGVGTGAGGGSTTGGISGSGTLTISGTGNLFASHITQNQLTVGSASTVTIADSAAPGDTAATSIVTDISNSGTLDLKNNDLVVLDTNQYPTVRTLINNAADTGTWDQPGITSSSAKANASGYGLGYAEASAIGSTAFDGHTFTDAVLVKYTLLGDTQLRGAVGIGDYDTVLNNFGTGTDWYQGNFHYSGTVGIGDYDDALNNFGAPLTGNLAPGPVLARGLSPAMRINPSFAKADLKLEVNTVTGDVYVLANTSAGFAGYTVGDPSAHLVVGGFPDSARLLSVAANSGGNTNVYESAGTYVNWNKITEVANQIAEGQNNNGYANHSSRDDTVNIPAGGTIDFGDIYNTAAGVQDITFNFAEAGSSPTNGPAYYGAEVDYLSGSQTPEPATLGVLGLMGVLTIRRRKRFDR